MILVQLSRIVTPHFIVFDDICRKSNCEFLAIVDYFMNGIYLIIGGNMGEREQYLADCRVHISNMIGNIERMSAVYESESWGNTEQNAFLNQVLFVKTAQNAREVLQSCLTIEMKMGRIRDAKWGSRIIDIDILFFNDEVIHENHLTIPHPHLQERRFVLVPLHELSPDLKHPVSGKTVQELLEMCNDPLKVFRVATSA